MAIHERSYKYEGRRTNANHEKNMARRFQKYQIDALNSAFQESEHLTKEKKLDLVRATGLDMEQVSNWFNRTRRKKRERESMGSLEETNAELKESIQEYQERVAKLHKELQESRVRRAEAETENHNLKLRLEIAESDLLVDHAIRFVNGHP